MNAKLKISVHALAACVALLAFIACSAAQQAKEKAAYEKADHFVEQVCAERAALKDAGLPPLVTDGCAPDASDAYWRCMGKP